MLTKGDIRSIASSAYVVRLKRTCAYFEHETDDGCLGARLALDAPKFNIDKTSIRSKMTLVQSIIAALAVSVFLYSFQEAQRYFKRRAIELQHGCQKPRSAPSRDPFFGLDSVYRILRSVEENRRNVSLKDQLDVYGYTFVSNLFGNTEVFSAEPRNLRAVFATDFESFGVQPTRLFVFKPLIGKGVMTMDGAYWANLRAQLQPIFDRAQITDLSAFDTHVTRLIDLIPKDCSTVDLQPLFARLALDSSSEFLFGESLGLLLAHPADDSQKF